MTTFDFKSIISTEFVSKILEKEGAKVESFTFCPSGTNADDSDNYLSSLCCVEVKLKNKNKAKRSDEEEENQVSVKRLFVKCYSDNIPLQDKQDRILILETEYFIYNQFLPVLNSLANEISDPSIKNEAKINAAKFYGGNIVGSNFTIFDTKPWTSHNFIVLEDLRSKNFRMMDRLQGLDLEHSLLAISQLANIHALSWALKKRTGVNKLSDKYPNLQDVMSKNEPEGSRRPLVDDLNNLALSVIQEKFGKDSEIAMRLQSLINMDVLGIIRKFNSNCGVDEEEAEKLLRIQPDTPISTDDEPWLVATHRDSWISNFMFLHNKNLEQDLSSVEEVVLVDHTNFRECCLTVDLCYFLYSSVTPHNRKTFTNKLLSAYFQRFTKIVSGLGENLPLGFTYEHLLRKWRRTRVYAVLMLIQFLPFVYEPKLLQKLTRGEGAAKQQSDEVYKMKKMDDNNEDDVQWKNILIETISDEYNDGIL